MAKKKLIILGIAVSILLAVYIPVFSKLQELKEENRNFERRIELLAKANEELRKEIDRLTNDPAYIEKIAREKLGMTRKNEIILK